MRCRAASFPMLALFVLIGGSAATPAGAQGLDTLFSNLFGNRRPAEPAPQAAPQKPRRATTPARPVFSVPVVDTEKPVSDAKIIVTVVGDSLGIQLGQGLRDALKGRPEVGFVNKARGNTGLSNTAERDWPKSMRDFAAGSERSNLAVVMIGSNDAQPLRDETGIVQEPLSERWADLYAKRIDEMLLPMQERKIPVLWVGLPISRSDRLNARFLGMNRLFRSRVEKAGGTYVDVWDAFADQEGRYQAVGPDIGGEVTKLRTTDGVHFTKPGQRKLAFFVEREAIRLLDLNKPDEAATMPDELREQIRRQGVPDAPFAPDDIRNAVPMPDVARLSPELRKREAGPIAPLTEAPVTPAGTLAQGQSGLPADPALRAATRLSDEVFSVGKAQYPKPNRGDDFGWPRR